VKLSDGRVANARIAVTGIAPRPYRARQAEQLLAGAAPAPGVLSTAAATVAADVHLLGDQHASADYRAHLAQVLTRRVLAAAIARARDSQPHSPQDEP
jgi:carbon-monoxide dehydrogenase medium subunit